MPSEVDAQLNALRTRLYEYSLKHNQIEATFRGILVGRKVVIMVDRYNGHLRSAKCPPLKGQKRRVHDVYIMEDKVMLKFRGLPVPLDLTSVQVTDEKKL